MVHYRRKRIAGLLAAALLLSLAACGNKSVSEDVGDTAAEAVTTSEVSADAAGGSNGTVETAAAKEAGAVTTEAVSEEAATSAAVTAETASASAQAGAAETKPMHVQTETCTVGITDQDTYSQKARVGYTKIELRETDRERFPELSEALQSYSDRKEVRALQSLDQLARSFEKALLEQPAANELPVYEDRTETYVVRADMAAFSLVNRHEVCSGSSDAVCSWECVNFDSRSGRQLKLTDIVTDFDAFAQTVEAKRREQYPEHGAAALEPVKKALKDIDTEINRAAWSLGYEGIAVYLNPFSLSESQEDVQVIRISFRELGDLVAKDYAAAKESYMVPLNDGSMLYVDTKANGKQEPVFITSEAADDYGQYYRFTVCKGDESCTIPGEAYNQKSYLVKTGGKFYLWMFATMDNDYTVLSCVDLSTMTCDEKKQSNLFSPTLGGEWQKTETGYVTWGRSEAFTDPDEVDLATRVTFLSSVSGIKTYRAGQDGWPVTDDAMYRFMSTYALMTKTELAVETVDEEGNKCTEETLPTGMLLVMVRGDGKTFADFQQVDLKQVEMSEYGDSVSITMKETQPYQPARPLYRVYEDRSEWPGRVNGIPESECFYGIMYAG